MSSNIGNNNWGKPSKRKSYTRRIPRDTLIDVAEARREIVYALHLHRSSSSFNFIHGKHVHDHHQQQPKDFIYSVMESLPFIPEPIWSTTAPSTCASPALEPELLDETSSSSSSYTWWLGFLKEIDSKSKQQIVIPSFEAARNDQVVQRNCVESSEQSGNDSWDACNYNLLVDEWLVNPVAEFGQGEISSGNDL